MSSTTTLSHTPPEIQEEMASQWALTLDTHLSSSDTELSLLGALAFHLFPIFVLTDLKKPKPHITLLSRLKLWTEGHWNHLAPQDPPPNIQTNLANTKSSLDIHSPEQVEKRLTQCTRYF